MWSKSENSGAFPTQAHPETQMPWMEINQPNHSHAEVAIFFEVERCQSSKRISGSILREIETIHDTLIFVSMAESSGYGHLRRPPKLKNFCT